MGHHHHKHRSNIDTVPLNEGQNMNYGPPQNQIPNLDQVSNNNQNSAQNQGSSQNGNMDMGPFADLFKNVDMNQISSMLSGFNGNPNGDNTANMNEMDRGTYIINTLKTFLPDERGRVLDDILRIYTLSKTISSQ